MMLRKLIDHIYLGAMPPSGQAFDRWLEAMADHQISDIICLATERDIAGSSLEYSVWRERPAYDDGTFTHPTLHDLPIPDYSIPAGGDRERFWDLAARVWFQMRPEGARVYVHCRAGVGRTGLFAAAVLRAGGYSVTRAVTEVRKAGSNPETERQMDFLAQGPPAGLFENYREHGRDWTPESKAATRDVIDRLDVAAFTLNKGCVVQHLSGAFGYISLEDAQRGRLVVRGMDTDEEVATFSSVDALIAAGWRVS